MQVMVISVANHCWKDGTKLMIRMWLIAKPLLCSPVEVGKSNDHLSAENQEGLDSSHTNTLPFIAFFVCFKYTPLPFKAVNFSLKISS